MRQTNIINGRQQGKMKEEEDMIGEKIRKM
jgi:hypothetical protein